jgi:hypothetical protein
MQQDKPDGGNRVINRPAPADPNRENVDALVSGFLEELAAISSEIKGMPQLQVIGKDVTQNPPATETNTPSLESGGKTPFETGLDIGKIQKELEESLNELEQLKAKVIPIMDRKDSRSEPPALSRTETKPSPGIPAADQPAQLENRLNYPESAPASAPRQDKATSPSAASASEPSAAPKTAGKTGIASQAGKAPVTVAIPSAPRESEEQAWNRLDLFRSQVASHKRFPWLKVVIWLAILVGLLAAACFFYVRGSDAPPATGLGIAVDRLLIRIAL